MEHIIIIVFAVIVNDDTYYWVYLSFDHLFQVYYKVRQILLQSATAFFITKCDSFFITKYDKCYYKVQQVLQSVTILLQSARLLQSGTVHKYTRLSDHLNERSR